MSTITVPLEDWKELTETVSKIERLLTGKSTAKVWVTSSEFMTITGLTRNQMNHIVSINPSLKRTRAGIGVQINIQQYNKIYQQ